MAGIMKNGIKKGLCLGMTAVMAFSLAACGKEGGQTQSQSANSALAKENVYSYEKLAIEGFENGSSYIKSTKVVDDRLFLLAEEYTNASSELRLISVNMDGGDVTTVELQMPEGESPDDQNEPDSEETTVAATEELVGDVPIEDEYGYSNVYESISYGNTAITDTGMLYAVRYYYYEDYSAEEPISINTNSLCCWDKEGNLMWQAPIMDQENPEEYVYVQAIFATPDGGAGVILSGESVQKRFVDAEGNVGEVQEIGDEASDAFSRMNYLIDANDGTAFLLYYDENWTNMYMATYDMQTDAVSEGVKMPDSMSWSGFNAVTAGGEAGDIVFSSNAGVYVYNMGDAEPTLLMNYINSDLLTSLSQITILDENRFMGSYYGEGYEISIFTKVNPEDIPDKKVLTLAGMWISSDVKMRVVDFNKTSQEYRIVLKEYDSYNTSEDYNAGVTMLNNDIVSGQMPDILYLSNNTLPIQRYVSKGLIADVGKLIEEDEELSQVEFMQNVFDAFSIDGKLYQVIPSFNVMTFAAKESIVGDRTSWTMQELQEVLASMPEGTQAFADFSRSAFIYAIMRYSGTDFVDVSTGKCNFDSPEFINMLEFAKSLPETIEYEDDYWMTYDSQYLEDRTILMTCYVSNVRDMNSTLNASFNEPVNFIGFPTDSGKGAVVDSDSTYAISAKSEYQDVAWDFVRYYLTDEYQDTLEWGLPTTRTAFTRLAQDALNKPFWIDENGEKVEYNDYAYINGESIELEPMTQEQIDQVVAMIENASKLHYYNEDVLNIISEESEAFFSGQKTANDVAQIIQSRIQIYVDENN